MARSRIPRTIGKILRLLLVLLILTVVSILAWRIFSSENYDLANGIQPNEALNAAYAEHGDDLILQYQNQNPSITRGEKNYGYFSVVSCVFIPQANQVQLVVRYNNSTLLHLQQDYGLSEIPDRTEDQYDVSIVLANSATGEKTRLHPTGEPIRENTRLYTYRRFTFENVTFDEKDTDVFVDIYYKNDVNYDTDAYGRVVIYDHTFKWLPYELSKEEKKRLDSAIQ
jgi:hypothetical protein